MSEYDGASGRVALLSLHTSPLDQPGIGDSGGMNVFILSVAGRLAELGVGVDVYTRCAGRGVPEVEILGPLTRVIQIPAGPCAPLSKATLPELVPGFANVVASHPAGGPYDLVHAHYWLSGEAALRLSRRWGVPLVASFHTLGHVKNILGAEGELLEPLVRLDAELKVVRSADRILAATPSEAAALHRLYGAPRDRVRVIPPGVDTDLFRPLPKDRARTSLGSTGRRVILFVGRLQPLKGPDVAIRAVAKLARRPGTEDVLLAVVGGASGGGGTVPRLRALADDLGVADRVRFLTPRPHHQLPEIYAAADVLAMPSLSESFGLVALEAQACGLPVVASSVGGLRFVVEDGRTGFLVRPGDPDALADGLLKVLADPGLAARLSGAGVAHAAGFLWEDTAARVLSVYRELVPGLLPGSHKVPA